MLVVPHLLLWVVGSESGLGLQVSIRAGVRRRDIEAAVIKKVNWDSWFEGLPRDVAVKGESRFGVDKEFEEDGAVLIEQPFRCGFDEDTHVAGRTAPARRPLRVGIRAGIDPRFRLKIT